MNKQAISAVFFLCLGLLMPGRLHAVSGSQKPAANLLLLYSNDVNGETEACG